MKPVWNTEKQIYYNYDNYFFFFLKKEMCIDLKKGTIIKGEKLCINIEKATLVFVMYAHSHSFFSRTHQ